MAGKGDVVMRDTVRTSNPQEQPLLAFSSSRRIPSGVQNVSLRILWLIHVLFVVVLLLVLFFFL